jgi:uncharacterized membrane protein
LSLPRPPESRLESVDLLRGLLMVLMALDHTRDFFTDPTVNAGDPLQSWPALFATRWVTHLCAPGFVALAGTSVYLLRQRGRSPRQVQGFLLSRGLWLILLELSVVSFVWFFSFAVVLQAIWVAGAGMIALAFMQRLPTVVVGCFGAAILVLHNLLDGIPAAAFGMAAPLWELLHQQTIDFPHGRVFAIFYPVLPWIGVICVGYACGPLVLSMPHQRQRWAGVLGAVFLGMFMVLRLFNAYGDHNPFQHLATHARTVMSFLRVEKYPPSLHYVLATSGLLLLLYSVLDLMVTRGWLPRLRFFLGIYGRVPLFFYVIHLYLIHSAALALSAIENLDWHHWLVQRPEFFSTLPGWGFSLAGVYLIWLCIVFAMYWPCWSFARLKSRRRDWWLSYL